ncbi:MAG TPA: hypothetical protein VNF04_00390 [Stellaceae bacterium]|nr:hypothetical protein [Stellaceae bacterium]
MNQQEHDAAVAAFIRRKGVTRCPTVCVVPTRASVAEADRQTLRARDEQLQARREQRKLREVAMYRFGAAA